MKFLPLIMLLYLLMASCNNAAKEQAAIQAAQKAVIDSISMANKLQAEQKAFADSIARVTHAGDSLIQAAQKASYDSVLQSQQQNSQNQQQAAQKEQQKQQLRNIIMALANRLQLLQQANIKGQSQLTVANDELRRTQEFQLLRSSSERSREINAASVKVNTIKTQLFNLSNEYQTTQTRLNENKAKLSAMN